MSNLLPPLPLGVLPGSGYWNDWYEKLRKIINDLISGAGHNTLAGLQGGSAGQYYHLTAAEYAALGTADAWTYIDIGSDTPVSAVTPTTVFSFTPVANTLYEVEGQLWLTIDDAAKGPQPGVAWNTGNDGGVAYIETTESTTTTKIANLTNGTDGVAAATSFPDATNMYPAQIKASFKTGATPSGTFDITLQSS
jgi:hypothetical protein